MRKVAAVAAFLALGPCLAPISALRPFDRLRVDLSAAEGRLAQGTPSLSRGGQSASAGTTDLDAFMGKVLARRDENWKKLQQYILDERQRVELRGPARMPIWGRTREYIWYTREGYFVRSPLRVDGVEIGESDRRKYEENFLRQEQQREKRQAGKGAAASSEPPPIEDPPSDLEGLIRQTNEPQFISSAYFLRFKFEPGRYALVGREEINRTKVLRVEYYPTRLFSDDDRREREQPAPKGRDKTDEFGNQMQRLMNKVSMVTLWVEPNLHQIVKYTFENVGLDFVPMTWLLRVDDIKATMVMREAFPGVWLPDKLDIGVAVVLALGRFDLTHAITYSGYRQADVKATIRGVRER